ncbi:hypothetical protein PHET_02487 [Paragonimus heterotremus]|uniref:TOG domain-containing protein n=1 Tax=Paragonimus heterotremus TaxID=100268 RepID=A0A8J4SRY8_9TREM|nr:hypothetical protein PHET_02487 [Paragonimus heterotremus]
MTTFDIHAGIERTFAVDQTNQIKGNAKFRPCRATNCVFSYFLTVCNSDLESRLFALNKVEAGLNAILTDSSRFGKPYYRCDCLKSGFENFLSALIGCIPAENLLLRRTATQCLRLQCRIIMLDNANDIHLTDFVSCLIKYGLSQNVPHNVKLSLCTALPQVFVPDLFECCKPRVQAFDFEPLFRALLSSFVNTSGSKSPFKYAFVSLLKVLGADVFDLIKDSWEKEKLNGIFPTLYLQLAHRWTSGLFFSRKCTVESSTAMRENDKNGFPEFSEDYSKTDIFYSPMQILNQDSIPYSEISPFLSRKAYNNLFGTIQKSKRTNNGVNCNNLNSYLAVEELRDTLVSYLSSPVGWKTLFNGVPKDSPCDTSLRAISPERLLKSKSLITLLKLLDYLMEDANFNVIVCCLDIATMLVEPFVSKTYWRNEPVYCIADDTEYAVPVCHCLAVHFLDMLRAALGDNKLVVRVAGTKLFHTISRLPRGAMLLVQRFIGPVLLHTVELESSFLGKYSEQSSRQSQVASGNRLCQEAVDLLTSILLTLPSSEFDLSTVCELTIVNGLLNRRPSVRVATLDCIAVIAHILGPGNLGPLLDAVSQAERRLVNAPIQTSADHSFDNFSCVAHQYEPRGSGDLWEVVQNRLARRQLPQLDSQCRVVRGFPISNPSAVGLFGPTRTVGSIGDREHVSNSKSVICPGSIILTDLESSNLAPNGNHSMNSTLSGKPSLKGLRRRPSAGLSRTSNRLPWHPQQQTSRNGNSPAAASSSGVSSTTSPRGVEASAQSGTQHTAMSDEHCMFGSVVTADSSDARSIGSKQGWPPARDRRLSRTCIQSDNAVAPGTQSMPSSGRISPISITPSPISADRTNQGARGSRGIPIPVPSGNRASATRRKPLLAPLQRKSAAPVPDCSPPLLPTRATIGRSRQQSGLAIKASNTESNRYTSDGTAMDSSSRKVTGRSPRKEDDSSSGCGDNVAAEGDYHDDYENDEDGDVEDDILDDDDEEDEGSDDESDSTDTERKKSSRSTGRKCRKASSNWTGDNKQRVGSTNRSVVCRSIDSELSEVSSIRSAASHRRAMRLFEEAERRRRVEDSHTPSAGGDLREPLHVSVTEANCPVPVLAPVVASALPINRAVIGKVSAKRRGTLTNQFRPTDAQTSLSNSSASDLKPAGSTPNALSESSAGGLSPTPLPAKYNPYTGASFRENPDYAGLVIGRATGNTGISTTSQSVQLSSTPDLHRLGQANQPGERRPLKGQHNINSGLWSNSLNISPQTDSSNPVSVSIAPMAIVAASSASAINVVGRGLFDSPTAPASFPSSKVSTASDSLSRIGRNSPAGTRPSDPLGSEPVDRMTDDLPMQPSVTHFGPGSTEVDASVLQEIVAVSSTDDPDTHVSDNFRQRVLQKKTKELQKLRRSANGNSTRSDALNEDDQHSAESPRDITGFVDSAPTNSTWPSTGSDLSGIVKNARLPASSRDITESSNRKNTLPPKHGTHRANVPDKLSRSQRAGSQTNISSGRSSSPSFQRVQSTDCLHRNLHSGSSDDVRHGRSSGDSDTPRSSQTTERPLSKGRSSLNINAGCPTLPFMLQLINSDDWEAKVSGLEGLAQIAMEKSATFSSGPSSSGSVSAGASRQVGSPALNPTEGLNQAVQAVITECRNLRSQVSRQAVQTLSCLFHGLGRTMDPHVDLCVRILLGKTGEAAAAFLRDEVAVAMEELTQAANPSRVLTSLMQHGLGHKNAAVRLQTALQVSRIVENLTNQGRLSQSIRTNASKFDGSSSSSTQKSHSNSVRITSWGSASNLQQSGSGSGHPVFQGGMMERMVIAMSQFLTDGNQDTRYHGRRLLQCLMQQSDFERAVRKTLTGQTLRVVREAMEQIQTKGVGEPPTVSAGTRRRGYSPAPSVSASRGSSAGNISKV